MAPSGSSGVGILARLARAITAGSSDAAGPPADDIELKKYDSDRAHELELNKFVHVFELERLKILQYLNGGAFGLAATFSTALTQSDELSRLLAFAAIACWILGLAAAAWATQRALDVQVAYAQAYHYRRRSIEWRRLGTTYPTMDERKRVLSQPKKDRSAERSVVKFVRHWFVIKVEFFVSRIQDRPAPKDLTVDTVDLKFNSLADESNDLGNVLKPKVKFWARASVVLFVVGATSMLASMATQEPREEFSLKLEIQQAR